MPIPIRSIRERSDQMIADIQSETNQQIPPLWESWDRPWSVVIAGLLKIVELASARAALNMLPSKTHDEDVLREFAAWGSTPRDEEVAAILNVSGTGVAAAVIGGGSEGAQYVSEDGQKFYFEEDYTIPSTGEFTTQIVAYFPGAQANLKSGDLFITGQNANISGTLAIVETDPIYREGKSQELFEDWRTNVNRSLQRPILPDNNSYFYETTRQTPGGEIVAGYPYVVRPGQLELYVRSAANNGVPTATQVQAVQEWYDGTYDGEIRIPPHYEGFLPDSPTTSRFIVRGCTNTLFQIKGTGLSPDNDTTQALLAADLLDWFSTRAPFIRGVNVINKSVIDQKSLTSIIQDRVKSGDIDDFNTIQFGLSGSSFIPLTTYTPGRGELVRTESAYIDWSIS